MIYQSEELLRRDVVVSGLVAAIDEELKRQGKNWAWLARETNFSEGTFSNWKSDPGRVPDLYTLALVSSKLKISLRVLIEACGYPVDESVEYTDRQARARALVAAVPRLAEVAEDIAKLKPDDQDALLVTIETWLQERERRRRQVRKGFVERE